MTEQLCPNCGAAVTGKYCSGCGQRHGDVRASFTRIIRDVLEDQLSLNATVPRTFAALLFLPGRLTRDYMALRIARYVPPVRLYLITSVLFFLALSLVSDINRTDFMKDLAGDSASLAVMDSIRAELQKSSAIDSTLSGRRYGVFAASVDSTWASSVQVNLGNERLNRLVRDRLKQLGHLPLREAFATVVQGFLQQIPKVMFLMLPVYALLLKVLYARRKRYFVEHFIFALHVHAFMFAIFLLNVILRDVPVVGLLLLLWIPLYSLLAMKTVYGQGWFKTGIKWLALGNAYLVVLSFGVLLGLTLAVLAL